MLWISISKGDQYIFKKNISNHIMWGCDRKRCFKKY